MLEASKHCKVLSMERTCEPRPRHNQKSEEISHLKTIINPCRRPTAAVPKQVRLLPDPGGQSTEDLSPVCWRMRVTTAISMRA